MNRSGRGDVLEIHEDSGDDDHEHEDFESASAGRRDDYAAAESTTVDFRPEPSEDPRKRRFVKRKRLTKKEASEKRRLAHDRKLLGLVRPDVTTNRERERLLKKIATKGVVQLFNAVAERQRILAEELSKKMSAKERRETERRLQGTAFRVYPESSNDATMPKKEEVDDDEEEVKQEGDDEME
ncbi:unnamed protein product [Heligmosomoides polygyrus]|uniref:RRP15-like protein n=1 Tax=Heligmosomoides polygyrus TaxID=6339 RepID=A0A183FS49_HELPZ|nr:unnamed protein product [Heligmosomoides polygyrus]